MHEYTNCSPEYTCMDGQCVNIGGQTYSESMTLMGVEEGSSKIFGFSDATGVESIELTPTSTVNYYVNIVITKKRSFTVILSVRRAKNNAI